MPYKTLAVAPPGCAEKALVITEGGVFDLRFKVKTDVAALVTFIRSSNSVLATSGQTKHTAETIHDGDTVGNTPIAPGSVVLTSSGSVPTLKDTNKDGILKADRTLGTVLESGIVGATSVPATRTLTAAGKNFTTAGVFAGDDLVIANGQDAGVYEVVTVGTTTLVVNRNFPVGSLTALTFSVVAKAQLTGKIDYFSGKVNVSYPSSPAAATPGAHATVVGINPLPVALTAGATMAVDIDAAGAATATFDAAQACHAGSAGGSLAASAAESLVLKINGGNSQTVTMGSGTETTAATYANKISAQLIGGRAEANANSLNAMLGTLNELKADYNAHCASAAIHAVADATNLITSPAATSLATAMTMANELKTDYNLHRAEAGVHVNNDAGNDITSPNATTLGTLVTLVAELKLDYNAHCAVLSTLEEAIVLVNELKGDYNAHRVLEAGRHTNDDATNVVSSGAATDLGTAITLANELRTDYNLHLESVTDLEECITILNELRIDYEAHRILVAGTVHAGADATNAVTAVVAIDYATALLLANDLVTQYEAHRVVTPAVHGAADATYTVTAPAATTMATLKTLTNELLGEYNGHRQLIAAGVHGIADDTNVTAAPAAGTAAIHLQEDVTNTLTSPVASTLATLKTLLNEMKTDYTAHIAGTTAHGVADATNTVAADAIDTAAMHQLDDATNVITSMPDSVEIYSDKYGTGSSVQVVSGTGTILAKIGHVASTAAGTGDVADISAVAFAELKTVIEADVADSLVTLEGSDYIRISSDAVTTGASSKVQVSAGTVTTALGLDTSLHLGSEAGAQNNVTAAYTKCTLLPANQFTTMRVTNFSHNELEIWIAGNGGAAQVEVEVVGS